MSSACYKIRAFKIEDQIVKSTRFTKLYSDFRTDMREYFSSKEEEKAVFHGNQHAKGRTERLLYESRTIHSDAVVVTEVAAARENGAGARIPKRHIGFFNFFGWGIGSKREIQASAVDVTVRQVAS